MLPAINLARGYLNDTQISFEEYLSMLKAKKEHVKLLKLYKKTRTDSNTSWKQSG